jgi:hypothetical protein
MWAATSRTWWRDKGIWRPWHRGDAISEAAGPLAYEVYHEAAANLDACDVLATALAPLHKAIVRVVATAGVDDTSVSYFITLAIAM